MSLQFLWILILNVLINSGMGVIIPVLPSFLKHDGFSTAGLTMPFVILIVGRFISKYYAGQLIHWLGDKKLLMACFVLYAGVFFTYPHIHSVLSLTLIRFFEGCVEGLAIICLTDMAITHSAENRGTLMGYFGSSFGLGFILGPLLGGLLYQYVSVTAMFYSGAFLGIFGIIICFLLNSLPSNYQTNKQKHKRKSQWLDYLPYLGIYAPSLMRRLLFFSFMILIPLYTTEYLHLLPSKAALYFSGSAILTTICMPFTGKLADRYSAVKIVVISLIVMGITIIAFGFVNEWVSFTVVFVLETIAFTFMLPAGMKIFANQVAELTIRQEIIGYFGSLTELCTLALALIIPYLYILDALYAWGFLGILCFISALPFIKYNFINKKSMVAP